MQCLELRLLSRERGEPRRVSLLTAYRFLVSTKGSLETRSRI